ncbi:MAG TPA: hypothetical protein VGO47_08410 [Chlamydiales bacterium]|nr:hypothetical protein [Chlamydiales bacterium]
MIGGYHGAKEDIYVIKELEGETMFPTTPTAVTALMLVKPESGFLIRRETFLFPDLLRLCRTIRTITPLLLSATCDTMDTKGNQNNIYRLNLCPLKIWQVNYCNLEKMVGSSLLNLSTNPMINFIK